MTHLRFGDNGAAQPQATPAQPSGPGQPPVGPTQPPTVPGQLPSAPPTTNKSAAQRLRERLLGGPPAIVSF